MILSQSSNLNHDSESVLPRIAILEVHWQARLFKFDIRCAWCGPSRPTAGVTMTRTKRDTAPPPRPPPRADSHCQHLRTNDSMIWTRNPGPVYILCICRTRTSESTYTSTWYMPCICIMEYTENWGSRCWQ